MTAREIAKYRAQSTSDQATTMHEAMKLMPDYGKDDLGIACLMAAAYNAGRAEAEAIPDNGGAQGFYLQEIVNTAKQITDAGMLKRIYLLARRLLGKQTQPTGQEDGREAHKPENWCERACALLPKLTAEDQEVVYWRMDTMLARPRKPTTTTLQAEAIEDTKFTLKALVNLEMADVTKPKTLDSILSYARIARQRE